MSYEPSLYGHLFSRYCIFDNSAIFRHFQPNSAIPMAQKLVLMDFLKVHIFVISRIYGTFVTSVPYWLFGVLNTLVFPTTREW